MLPSITEAEAATIARFRTHGYAARKAQALSIYHDNPQLREWFHVVSLGFLWCLETELEEEEHEAI